MSNLRTIQYGIDRQSGDVCSRIGSEVAWPVLDFDGMLPENNFAMRYNLEKMNVLALAGYYQNIKWTRKVPLELKNAHRVFWGMKPIKDN